MKLRACLAAWLLTICVLGTAVTGCIPAMLCQVVDSSRLPMVTQNQGITALWLQIKTLEYSWCHEQRLALPDDIVFLVPAEQFGKDGVFIGSSGPYFLENGGWYMQMWHTMPSVVNVLIKFVGRKLSAELLLIEKDGNIRPQGGRGSPAWGCCMYMPWDGDGTGVWTTLTTLLREINWIALT